MEIQLTGAIRIDCGLICICASNIHVYLIHFSLFEKTSADGTVKAWDKLVQERMFDRIYSILTDAMTISVSIKAQVLFCCCESVMTCTVIVYIIQGQFAWRSLTI